MAEKDYWSEDEQIYFLDGKGYGITGKLATVCLGSEIQIIDYLKEGSLPENITSQAIQTLIEIKEQLKDGESTVIRTPVIKQRNNKRIRPLSFIRRYPRDSKQAKVTKKLSLHHTR